MGGEAGDGLEQTPRRERVVGGGEPARGAGGLIEPARLWMPCLCQEASMRSDHGVIIMGEISVFHPETAAETVASERADPPISAS